MKTLKFLIISILLFVSLFVEAQVKPGKLRDGRYVVTTGDTTKIVMYRGVKDPNSKFLFSTSRELIDSLYAESDGRMTNTEALREVSTLLDKIERDQGILEAGNNSLSYRLSREYIAANKKEKSAKAYADSMMLVKNKETEEQLALNFLMYGDKPSYYVNGMQVSSYITSLLIPGDVVSRSVKTNTPNPNGEIWLTLTEKALRRLKLPVSESEFPKSNNKNEQVYDLKGAQQQRDREEQVVTKEEPREQMAEPFDPRTGKTVKKTVRGRPRY